MHKNDIEMTVKRLPNTHEKARLEGVKISKPFHKRNESIPPHSNLTNKRNMKKVTKPNTKINSTNTKNLKQMNILKNIFMKIALK